MRGVRRRALDMFQAIANIERHAADGEERFRSDEVFQGYIMYQLMIVGEAAFKMPAAVRERYPEIPWKTISALRHVLVHGYFLVDLDIVWGIVQQDLPVLKAKLERILEELQ